MLKERFSCKCLEMKCSEKYLGILTVKKKWQFMIYNVRNLVIYVGYLTLFE